MIIVVLDNKYQLMNIIKGQYILCESKRKIFFRSILFGFYGYFLLLFFAAKLPFSIRVLLESAVRNCDNFHVNQKDVENILSWEQNQENSVEIPFKPARVILQDFT